ncbi:MAG: hypothetical protein H6765_11005 [Candidatus Peribacteria bacterium]|nr:MAG: hypothetical protein H6765_11005 [Candidatus Peribacteria bacterium]
MQTLVAVAPEAFDANKEKQAYRKVFHDEVDKLINHEYDAVDMQKNIILDLYELKKEFATVSKTKE